MKFDEIKNNFNVNFELNYEVFKFLASVVSSSIREIVGALNRILAFVKINTKSPTIYECSKILKDFINSKSLGVHICKIFLDRYDFFKELVADFPDVKTLFINSFSIPIFAKKFFTVSFGLDKFFNKKNFLFFFLSSLRVLIAPS